MGPATASLHLGSMQKTLSILAVLHFTLAAAESLQDGAEFDYIVIGGGAAGEIVATRLSENHNIMVALLESGEEPDLNMGPNNFPKVSQGGDRYGFSTYQDGFSAQYIQDENVRVIAEEFTGGATPWVHMMHLRGHPDDYQRWADAAGDDSWNYENMLRYFIRSEQVKDKRTLDSSVTGYGTEGTLNLTRESSDANSKIIQAFKELGFEYHLNLNATLGITEPLYYMYEGRFQSIYQSYIFPARNRSNLFIYPNTTATLIRFDDDRIATGVQAYNSKNTYVEVRARQEIILAGGVMKTPQLMLLSGIGPASDLNDWSISVVSDLPVGEGMSDRVGAIVAFKLKESNDSTQTSNDYMAPTTVAFKALDSLEDTPDYQATNHIFPRNSQSLPKLCVDSYQYKAEICEKLQEINSEHELMFSVVSITRPQSTGFMALNSLDMFDDPFIYMGYFAETADLENLAAYLKDFSNIANTENLGGLESELVDLELAECGSLQQSSQDYWMCYGQYMSTTTWNVVGTAQMGDVLDSKLNVRGVQKLRVVDSSAIPFAHSGYLLPSIIVMAEKAADLILDKVEIGKLVTDVSEENFLASKKISSVSGGSSSPSDENSSAQETNDLDEDSSRSETQSSLTSENEAALLSKDEQISSASDENATAQGSNDLDEKSSSDSKGNVSAQETHNLNENEDSPRFENEAAAPSLEDQATLLHEDKDSASASEESSLSANSTVAKLLNLIVANSTLDVDEEMAVLTALLFGGSGSESVNETVSTGGWFKIANETETNSTLNALNIRAVARWLRFMGRFAADKVDESLKSDEAASLASENVANSTLDVDEETESQLEAVLTALLLLGSDSESVNETVSTDGRFKIANETETNSTLNALNIRAVARWLRFMGKFAAYKVDKSLDDTNTPVTDDKAKPALGTEDAALSGSEGEIKSAENVFVRLSKKNTSDDETTLFPLSANSTVAKLLNLIVANSTLDVYEEMAVLTALLLGGSGSESVKETVSTGDWFKIANETETNSTLNALNIRAVARWLRLMGKFAAYKVDKSLDDTNTPVTDDKAKPALGTEDAALSGSEGEIKSADNVFVRLSKKFTSDDETTLFPLSANSTVAKLLNLIVANSTLDVDEEMAVLTALLLGGSGSESVNETVSTGGWFKIANETETNSTLNALNIRAVARWLRFMGRFAADKVDESLKSDEAASLASENVANSTLDVDEETESQLKAVLTALLLLGSDSESINETVSTDGRFKIANETETNSTLNALNIRAVARWLRLMGTFAAYKVDKSLDDTNTPVTDDKAKPALGTEDAALSGSEGEIKSAENVFVQLSKNFTSDDETTLFPLSANSTEAKLLNLIVANSTLDVDEEMAVLTAILLGGSGSESVKETVSTDGRFKIANETETNSTLNALNIRAVARWLRFMGKFAAYKVDKSLDNTNTPVTDDKAKPALGTEDAALSGSEGEIKSADNVFVRLSKNFTSDDETTMFPLSANSTVAKLLNLIVANSTLDVDEEMAVLTALLLGGSGSESVKETVSTGDWFKIANETETNSTLNALNIRAVARWLRFMGRFAADKVDESLKSDEAASLASENVANSTVDVGLPFNKPV